THARPSTWVTGASAGVPGNASGWEVELFTISAHTTRVVAGRLGADFAVGTMPRILVEGVLPLGARAGHPLGADPPGPRNAAACGRRTFRLDATPAHRGRRSRGRCRAHRRA